MRKNLKLALLALAIMMAPVSALDAYAEASASSQTSSTASAKSVSGVILDQRGEPVIGATVAIKGTTNGTATDIDGNFTLKNVKPSDVILVTYVGCQPAEVTVGNNRSVEITLKDDSQVLDEVVAVGYATQKKVNLTGSVASVNFEDEKLQRPVTTIASALSGAAAGLNVMNTSSKPNSEGSSVTIRGVGTMNNTAPLILVDGMEMGLNEINPNDVASVSILKDAASCAIYGNRGANGVILVTTKRGQEGKVTVTYSGKFSLETPAKMIHQISDYAKYMELINEAYTNTGQAAKFSQSTIDEWREAAKNPNAVNAEGIPNYVSHPNTDWRDVMYNNHWMMEHTVTVSGAEKRTTYSLSGTYLDNPGLVINSGAKKYYFRSDVESRPKDFLTVGLRAWGYKADHQRNDVDGLYGFMMEKTVPGVYPYYNGQYGGPETAEEDGVAGNPLLNLSSTHGYYKQIKVYVNPYVEVSFLKDFKVRANFYYDKFENNHKWLPGPYLEQVSFNRGIPLNSAPTADNLAGYTCYDWTNRDQSWKTNVVGTYAHSFGKHDVSALLGYEEYRKWGDVFDIAKMGMSSIDLTDWNALTKPNYISGNSWEYSSRSLFGRVNYAYDGRYLFEADIRYDGSSRFSPESRWGVFPSFSAGWRISQESFMKDIDWLSNLKLRASWGKLGNNAIGNYEWQSLYGTGFIYAFNGSKTPGLAMTKFSNAFLEWEETAVTNIGVDFGFLKNRLNGSLEFYYKDTDGILYRPTLPESLNQFTSPLMNLAAVSNKGFELGLTWDDRAGDFTYHVGANFSYNINRVTEYKGELIREWRTDEQGNRYWYSNIGEVANGWGERIVEGHEMNEYYYRNLYRGNAGNVYGADGKVDINAGPKDGMIRTERDMEWLRAMVDAGYKFYPGQKISKDAIWYGDPIFADYNGDGIYGDDEDRDFQGASKVPKFYFGLQGSVTWKDFDLSMSWAGAGGNKIWYNYNTINSVRVIHGYGIGKDLAYDHYFYDPENPDDPRTNITSENPRLHANGAPQSNADSERILKSGTYMKLKNLTFGYTIPSKWTRKAFIEKARVYFSGENLFCISAFPGLDPESMSDNGYSPIRSYTFGLNVTF